MADQGKWFKLWVNALTDPTLEELDTEQWFRWVRLGVFIKAHGEAGELTFSSPGRALQNLLRVDNLLDMIKCIKKLPGYVIEENVTATSQTPSLGSVTESSLYTVKCQNWHKYQGDMSVKRTRKWRAKRTVTSDGKSDDLRGEEKRREERRRDVFVKPTLSEIESFAKTAGLVSLDARRFFDFYESKGWVVGRAPMKDWKAAARNWEGKTNETKSGVPTWMKNQ